MEVNMAPPALLQAMEQQRSEVPDDEAAIERLKLYLKRTRPTFKEIRISVCEFYGIEREVMMSHHRDAGTAIARQILYYLVYRYTRLSMIQIAAKFGHVDHTSVHHGIHLIEGYAATRPLVRDDIDLLRLRICEKLLERPIRVMPC